MVRNDSSQPPTASTAERRARTLPMHGTAPPSRRNVTRTFGGWITFPVSTPRGCQIQSPGSSATPLQLYQVLGGSVEDLRIADVVQNGHLLRQLVRQVHVVGVEKGQILTRGMMDTEVSRRAGAPILAIRVREVLHPCRAAAAANRFAIAVLSSVEPSSTSSSSQSSKVCPRTLSIAAWRNSSASRKGVTIDTRGWFSHVSAASNVAASQSSTNRRGSACGSEDRCTGPADCRARPREAACADSGTTIVVQSSVRVSKPAHFTARQLFATSLAFFDLSPALFWREQRQRRMRERMPADLEQAIAYELRDIARAPSAGPRDPRPADSRPPEIGSWPRREQRHVRRAVAARTRGTSADGRCSADATRARTCSPAGPLPNRSPPGTSAGKERRRGVSRNRGPRGGRGFLAPPRPTRTRAPDRVRRRPERSSPARRPLPAAVARRTRYPRSHRRTLRATALSGRVPSWRRRTTSDIASGVRCFRSTSMCAAKRSGCTANPHGSTVGAATR